MTQNQDWAPDSWHRRTAAQQPTYANTEKLQADLQELAALPPLVTSAEVESLRLQLADAEAGRSFVLQGGDCAESFSECRPQTITNRLKVLLQMSLVLVHGLERPITRIGRCAGQYAKPRSADTETRDGVTLPSYRGDIVNGPDFTVEARAPDSARMLEAHARSAMTMNFVRGLIDGGFADLHHPEYWRLDWVSKSSSMDRYTQIVESIGHGVRFMESLAGRNIREINRVDFYTSHEALLLYYEQAQTRQVPRQQGWYNLSTHLPWIGARTAEIDGAHVEYCSGIRNPVGLKVGPAMQPAQVAALCERLNPAAEAGKLVLIHRLGAKQVDSHLPAIIEAVRASGIPVLWMCDPMHGNTQSTSNGYKTRAFNDVMSELAQSIAVHRAQGTALGGVHLELTGDDVTECIGGASELVEADLARAYRGSVDPRLNYEQSLELSMKLADLMVGR